MGPAVDGVEVVRGVVGLILVAVVDYFGRLELSPELRFGHPAVGLVVFAITHGRYSPELTRESAASGPCRCHRRAGLGCIGPEPGAHPQMARPSGAGRSG